jgi:protein-S-isoprenylcysteine O-methyltransferase Ste14
MDAGTLTGELLSAGNRNRQVAADLPPRPLSRRWYRPLNPALSDVVSRACIGTLFTLLTINLFGEYMRTGHVTGLLLIVGESLVVVLTIMRRRAIVVDRSAVAAVLTTLSLVGPVLLRAADGVTPLAADQITAMASAIGLVIVVLGKMTLGRSFGIVPANRGVVARGPYNFVRHPIYAGYLITHAAFLMAHPAPWNVTVVVVADVALIFRALIEERVLSTDATYRQYCERVAWHLVPGVF